MSDAVTALVATGVVVLVVVRRFRPQQLRQRGRWWVLPVVLGVVALQQPGLLDSTHLLGEVALLAAQLLTGAAMGVLWAWTTRVWTAADGTLWGRSTAATGLVWVGGLVVRAGLLGVGALCGIRSGGGVLLLGLAVSLLARDGLLAVRGTSAGQVPGQTGGAGAVAGHEAGVASRLFAAGKER